MHYMEESTEENACNEVLKEIHGMVTKVKHDRRVSIEYMKIFEREKMIYEDGLEEGMEKGVFALIADNLEFGVSIDKINVKLEKIFALNEKKAQEYIDGNNPTIGMAAQLS